MPACYSLLQAFTIGLVFVVWCELIALQAFETEETSEDPLPSLTLRRFHSLHQRKNSAETVQPSLYTSALQPAQPAPL